MDKADQDMYEEVRKRAENYFKQDYNCAQAVALSNLELLGGQTSGVLQLAAGFGHGMSAGCTCGALVGGVMAISLMLAGPETKGFDSKIMEAAAQLALLRGACRYRSIASILKNSLDRQPLPTSPAAPAVTPPRHDNIRGAEYFE